MHAVTVSNVHKTYGRKKDRVTALQDISFAVNKGELFGLIGPDGAGKTSLFRILTTLLLADSGSASVEGLDVVKNYAAIRKRVGYMPGRFSLYPDLTVQENMDFFATLFNTSIEANYHLVKDIYRQIEPFRHRRAGQLSGGMKQKLALSCALIHQPSVLFLDEPTTGVDAVSRKEFWDMLTRLTEQGITILVSTPYMDEAARCDRVALMQNGQILSIDTPVGVVNSFTQPLWAARSTDMLPLLQALKKIPAVENAYPSGIYHHVVMHTGSGRKELEAGLRQQEIQNAELIPATVGIEDCFMKLMKSSP